MIMIHRERQHEQRTEQENTRICDSSSSGRSSRQRKSTGVAWMMMIVSFIALFAQVSQAWTPATTALSSSWIQAPQPLARLSSVHYRQSVSSFSSASSATSAATSTTQLYAAKQTRASSASSIVLDKKTDTATNNDVIVDDDVPAGITGANFFGGNKEKEDFYDAEAEERASVITLEEDDDADDETVNAGKKSTTTTTTAAAALAETLSSLSFDRFADRSAFKTDMVAQVAKQMQQLINQALYEDGKKDQSQILQLEYSKSLVWESPLVSVGGDSAAASPLQALTQAMEKYRRVDVAVTSGKLLKNGQEKEVVVQLSWEISLAWPTFWEPQVLITGSSQLTMIPSSTSQDQTTMIVHQQVDSFYSDDSNTNTNDQKKDLGKEYLQKIVGEQLLPRFWDLYHIGMTASAETLPQYTINSGIGGGIKTVQIPGRWMVAPTMLDLDNNRNLATALPFHAFNTIVKTVGPTKQRYVPTTPLEIQIINTVDADAVTVSPPLLTWKVPMSVEFQSQVMWPAAMVEDESDDSSSSNNNDPSQPTCAYSWIPPRKMAIMEYKGGPQDEGIPAARKRLYEKITSASNSRISPKLDENGRPIFTYWKKAFKGCFTEEGLGMAVYEWRPSFAAENKIGMELQD